MVFLSRSDNSILARWWWTVDRWNLIQILILAAIGNILLGLLAWSAYQAGFDGAIWAVIGAVMLAIQVIINDAIWWSIKFPW